MKISGHVDLCGPDLIEGWLHCNAWEGEPIKLQVFVDSVLIGECEVDRFRNDLQEAGFGDGRCGFSFSVPAELGLENFADTKLRLIDTPVYLLPDEFSNVSSPAHLAAGAASAVAETTPDYLSPIRPVTPETDAKAPAAKTRFSNRIF